MLYDVTPTRCIVTARMTVVKVSSCVSHINVLLTVRAKSQDGVHKPQILTRKGRGRRFEFES